MDVQLHARLRPPETNVHEIAKHLHQGHGWSTAQENAWLGILRELHGEITALRRELVGRED